jgi:hypothetical protein
VPLVSSVLKLISAKVPGKLKVPSEAPSNFQVMLVTLAVPQSAFSSAWLLGRIEDRLTSHVFAAGAAHAPPVARRASARKPPCARRRQDANERIFII